MKRDRTALGETQAATGSLAVSQDRAPVAVATPLPCRWLLHEPAAGAWNMALDEALLESAAADGVATLRCYGWSEPTLSLGYFQPAAQRETHAASRSCPLVRRASGGGAIVHDDELTYSFVIPVADRLAADVAALYATIHGALIEALAAMGVSTLRCETVSGGGQRAFLCFQRRAAGDLLVAGHKIAGSAQRRDRGAVLQHGSILLAASRCAPELPGIAELTGRRIDREELADLFRLSVGRRMNIAWRPPADEPELSLRAEAIAREKFSAARWTFRR